MVSASRSLGDSSRTHCQGRSDLHDGLSAHGAGVRRRLDLRHQRHVASVGYVAGWTTKIPELIRITSSSRSSSILLRGVLEGGKMVRYGAKSLPYGGWLTMPKLAGDGWMLLGDSASFLNSQRLKGIHLAIKSGMLAAETAFDAMLAGTHR